MPMYTWIDKNKDEQELDVMRSFDDYKVPPTEAEAIADKWTEEEAKAAKWIKVIGKNIQVTKSDNWGPGKGNW